MFTEEEFDDCLSAAAALDGSSIVDGGGIAAVYVGRIGHSSKWVAIADWFNEFHTDSLGESPSHALKNLTTKLDKMKSKA
ncbi:hypothetical protein C4577_02240 [Candidatus Parcubacteria bacterium]|nr:MAG: hypothetical protein C4577_02240 [Candidatus Parcubacteria bacterium]